MSNDPKSLVDSHVHLQEEVLEGHLDEVLTRARAAGVTCMVCNGTHEGDWPQVRQLAEAHRDIVPFFGLHPWFVSERSAHWQEKLAAHLAAIPSGIGEIGLDRWLRERDEKAQEQVFLRQLELARELQRPVVIHCLRAWGWLMRLLEPAGPPPSGMLIHAYGGAAELVEPLVRMGAYFSFAGNALKKGSRRAHAALSAVPADRLLVETDAPAMLPPQDFRPHAVSGEEGALYNEPANLPAIVSGLSQMLQTTPEALAKHTAQNARRFLGALACPTNAL